MNRRSFLKLSGTGTAIAVVTPMSLVTTGCVSVVSLANDFIATATAIVNADPTGPWVSDLELAIAAMKTAVAGWNGSSANCALQSAANAAAQIINQIDPGSTVALIAAVAIAGFDVLMENLAPCSTTEAKPMQAGSTSIRNTPGYAAAKKNIQGAWFKSHAYRKEFNNAAKASGLSVRI